MFKESIKRVLYMLGLFGSKPPVGAIKWGSFATTTPFSLQFGYNRGGPVDRYYIEKFLAENKQLICGRVLEIGDNDYTLKFGGNRVKQSDVLYVDDTNSNATIIADLTNAPQIPSESFDCIILTQTLQFIYDYKAALQTCQRILKKGGALIVTVPGISHIDYDEWGKSWFYSFTEIAVQRMLEECFDTTSVQTKVYGNVKAAAAFLYGAGAPEIDHRSLDVCDPHYQLIVAATAIKK